MNPEQIDKQEDARVARMLKEAKSNRGNIREYRFKKKHPKKKDWINVYLPKGGLAFSSSLALGDWVRNKLEHRAKREFLKDPGRVLVKDGKLTEEGIKAGIKLPI